MLPEGIPEHKRRAVRLGLAVLLPCLIGYGVIGPEHVKMSADAQTLSKWAAITAAIVSAQPLIGKAAQVGADRVIGTVLGGVCGVVVHFIGSRLLFDEYSDGAWLAISAAALAGCSVLVGKRLKLETSARLFVITLLLVTFATDEGMAAWRIALVRVVGIVTGVVLTLLLSVLLLPKSATVECLHCIDHALQSMDDLYRLCWHDYLQPVDPPSPTPAPALAPAPARGLARALETATVPFIRLSSAQVALLASEAGYSPLEDVEERCEAALTGIYSALFALADNVAAAKAERLVGRVAGGLVFVPGLTGREEQHLPWEGLSAVATSARRVSRILFSLAQVLEEGAGAEVRGAVADAEVRLKRLAAAGQAALSDIREAFPARRAVPAQSLLSFLQLVEEWEAAGGAERQAELHATRRYQRARTDWRHLISALKARSRGGNGGGGAAGVAGLAGMDTAAVPPPVQSEGGRGAGGNGSDTGKGSEALKPAEAGGAQTEWQSLTFLLRALGVELAGLHQRVAAVLQQLP